MLYEVITHHIYFNRQTRVNGQFNIVDRCLKFSTVRNVHKPIGPKGIQTDIYRSKMCKEQISYNFV